MKKQMRTRIIKALLLTWKNLPNRKPVAHDVDMIFKEIVDSGMVIVFGEDLPAIKVFYKCDPSVQKEIFAEAFPE